MAAVYAQIGRTVPNKPHARFRCPRRLLPGSLEAAVAQGTTEHPAVLAALFGVDAAGYAVKSEEGRLPAGRQGQRLRLQGRRRRQYCPGPGTVTIPIYQGGAASASVRQAKERLGPAAPSWSIRRAARSSSRWCPPGPRWEHRWRQSEANRSQISAANLALNGVVEERRVGQRTHA